MSPPSHLLVYCQLSDLVIFSACMFLIAFCAFLRMSGNVFWSLLDFI